MTIDEADNRINDVGFSADSKYLVTANESGTAKLWRLAKFHPSLRIIADDSRETQVAAYSPDGTKFVTGGRDGFAKLYSVSADGDLHFMCSVNHKRWVIYVAFSSDGAEVATAGLGEALEGHADTIKLWRSTDCRTTEPSGLTNAYVGGLSFDPHQHNIVWGGADGEIRIARLDQGGVVTAFTPREHDATVTEVSFSKDGRYLASGGRDGRVVVWDVQMGKALKVLLGGGPPVETVQISPGGLLAAGGSEGRIHVWDLERDGALVKDLQIADGAYRLAFDNFGDRLAVGTTKRTITEWSVPAWLKTRELDVGVGLRSVFGYRSGSNDLAFDGENGLIKIVPQSPPKNIEVDDGFSRGIETTFDLAPAHLRTDTYIRPAFTTYGSCGGDKASPK